MLRTSHNRKNIFKSRQLKLSAFKSTGRMFWNALKNHEWDKKSSPTLVPHAPYVNIFTHLSFMCFNVYSWFHFEFCAAVAVYISMQAIVWVSDPWRVSYHGPGGHGRFSGVYWEMLNHSVAFLFFLEVDVKYLSWHPMLCLNYFQLEFANSFIIIMYAAFTSSN